jgi:CRP-like cAMP-binding protein
MMTTDSAVLTPIDKVLSLQSVDVFRHATTEMLAYIGSIATELRMKREEVVFLKDQLADAMYVVVRGRVRLEKEGKEVLVVGAGQSFGTWALFDDQPRLMTAVLLENTHLLKIKKDDFYDLLADHDEITPVIFKALVERVKSLIPD